MSTVELIVEKVRRLPLAGQLEALEIVERIERTINTAGEGGSDESAIESVWAKEAEDRLDAYQKGEIKSSPAEDVLDRVKDSLRS